MCFLYNSLIWYKQKQLYKNIYKPNPIPTIINYCLLYIPLHYLILCQCRCLFLHCILIFPKLVFQVLALFNHHFELLKQQTMCLSIPSRQVFFSIDRMGHMFFIKPIEMDTPQVMWNEHKRSYSKCISELSCTLIIVKRTIVPMTIPIQRIAHCCLNDELLRPSIRSI